MDTTTLIILIVSIALMCIIVWRNFGKTKVRKQLEKELEMSLEDETIYDPETGERMTLEEAENASFFQRKHQTHADIEDEQGQNNTVDPRRIKPDEEIEKFFRDEAKEVQYVKRAFYQDQLKDAAGAEFFIHILEQTEMYKRYNSIDFYEFYDFSEQASIGLANVSYEIFKGDGAEMYDHMQLFGFRILEDGETIPVPDKQIHSEQRGNVLIIKSVKKIERTDYLLFKSILASKQNP